MDLAQLATGGHNSKLSFAPFPPPSISYADDKLSIGLDESLKTYLFTPVASTNDGIITLETVAELAYVDSSDVTGINGSKFGLRLDLLPTNDDTNDDSNFVEVSAVIHRTSREQFAKICSVIVQAGVKDTAFHEEVEVSKRVIQEDDTTVKAARGEGGKEKVVNVTTNERINDVAKDNLSNPLPPPPPGAAEEKKKEVKHNVSVKIGFNVILSLKKKTVTLLFQEDCDAFKTVREANLIASLTEQIGGGGKNKPAKPVVSNSNGVTGEWSNLSNYNPTTMKVKRNEAGTFTVASSASMRSGIMAPMTTATKESEGTTGESSRCGGFVAYSDCEDVTFSVCKIKVV